MVFLCLKENKKILTYKFAVVTIASAMLFGVAPAFASGAPAVIVGTCPHATPSGVGFFIMPSGPAANTITGGLSMVSPGGTVYVCPGTYTEQVSIGINVNLIGLYKSGVGPVIASPAVGVGPNTTDLYDGSPVDAQVLVEGGKTANINGFTVDGSNNQIAGCAPNLVGVYYRNSSGILANVSVTNTALSPALFGCQVGLGVYIESGYTVPGISLVQVQNVSVTNFQKNGITADGPGTNVVINDNVVTGIGPTALIGQNGIQVSDGAVGSVSNNQVANIDYTGPYYQAAGILIYASKGVSILGNTITAVQLPINTYSDPTDPTATNPTGTADGAIIQGNTITGLSGTNFGFLTDGIDVCSSFNTISLNTISNTALDGIEMDQGCTTPGTSDPSGNFNTVLLNNIQNSCSAILVDGPTTMQNLILLNTASSVQESIATNGSCPGTSISNPLQVRILPFKLGYHH